MSWFLVISTVFNLLAFPLCFVLWLACCTINDYVDGLESNCEDAENMAERGV